MRQADDGSGSSGSVARDLAAPRADLRDRLGICQWFHFEDYRSVEQSVELIAELNLRHLRTGVSWADFLRPGGKRWYDWQMKTLHEAGVEVLLSVWHTPPSLSEGNSCNSPPRRLRDYADFIDLLITEYGHQFAHLELWNEPNNRLKWDFPKFDPQWKKFGEMIGAAAYWAKQRGRQTVLGGMIPVDPQWLTLMGRHGVLACTDVVGIHGFPGMWFPHHPNWDWCSHWTGWTGKVESIATAAGDRPIWVTETGLATWDLALNRVAKFDLQAEMLRDAATTCPAERLYWYSLVDLDPGREAIEGFHVDENEYHMGLVSADGERKPAFAVFSELLSISGRATEEGLSSDRSPSQDAVHLCANGRHNPTA
jgi:CDP-paratose 2-epimerase